MRAKLEEHQYSLYFKLGINNTNANTLSRIHKVTIRAQSTLAEHRIT